MRMLGEGEGFRRVRRSCCGFLAPEERMEGSARMVLEEVERAQRRSVGRKGNYHVCVK